MTIERPILNRHISMADFRSFFWLKEELIEFCKGYELDTNGNRDTLTERIEWFLVGGQMPQDQARKKPEKHLKPQMPILADSIIIPTKRTNQEIKCFYKALYGSNFLATIEFVEYIRSCTGLTWQQAGMQWQNTHGLSHKASISTIQNMARGYRPI